MTDMAEGYGVRAYSGNDGNEIHYYCEKHYEEQAEINPDPVIVIEEYEGEDTLAFAPDYICEVCTRKQYEIDGPDDPERAMPYDDPECKRRRDFAAALEHLERARVCIGNYGDSELDTFADFQAWVYEQATGGEDYEMEPTREPECAPPPLTEEARPHQRDLMLERIATKMNEERDVQASYRHGGIDLFQGSDGIGWIYHRITCDRSGEAWEKERDEIAAHERS